MPRSESWHRFLSPEDKILLYCARNRREEYPAVQSLWMGPVDGAVLYQSARFHRMVPLLYCYLNKACPSDVPVDFFARLKTAYWAQAAHNLLMARVLLDLLASLKDCGILAIPLKGPTLAVIAYGHLALRSFSDLDIWVHPQNASKAVQSLLSQGYTLSVLARNRASLHVAPLSSGRMGLSFSPTGVVASDEKGLTLSNGQTIIDLHWEAAPYRLCPTLLSFNDVQQRLQPVGLAGTNTQTLSDNDLLRLLCMHGTAHGWSTLEAVCSVAALIRTRTDWDWNTLIQPYPRMFALGLNLAYQLLGSDIPEEIRRKGDSQLWWGMQTWVMRRLFSQTARGRGVIRQIGHEWIVCGFVLENTQSRFEFYMAYFHLSVYDIAFCHFPRPFAWLYYVVRMVRVFTVFFTVFFKESHKRLGRLFSERSDAA